MAKPAKGKRFTKIIKTVGGRTRKVSYGQAGKAKDGGDRIRPSTSKADAYCARSNKIKGDWRSDPNSPNNLSRRKWKCIGNKSRRD
jgi:hypothetical protein